MFAVTNDNSRPDKCQTITNRAIAIANRDWYKEWHPSPFFMSSIAKRIRDLRIHADLSLDELAEKAGVSKTYLWELENDEKGEKKPSADILLRIANALNTTIATLMALPTVQIERKDIQLSPSLLEFKKRMEQQETKLSDQDLRELATMKFRGGQPQTADDWQQLYLILSRNSQKKK